MVDQRLVARVGVLPFGFWWDRNLDSVSFEDTRAGEHIWETVPEFGVHQFKPFAVWVWGNCRLSGLWVGNSPQPLPPREWTKPFMPYAEFLSWIRRHYQNANGVAREYRLPVEFNYMPWCVGGHGQSAITRFARNLPKRLERYLSAMKPAITYSTLVPGMPLRMRLEGEAVAAVVWGNYRRELSQQEIDSGREVVWEK